MTQNGGFSGLEELRRTEWLKRVEDNMVNELCCSWSPQLSYMQSACRLRATTKNSKLLTTASDDNSNLYLATTALDAVSGRGSPDLANRKNM